MRLLTIPYLRPHFRYYLSIGVMVGVIVGFILIFFQPFGTANFTHEYKSLILAGYGLVIAVITSAVYLLSLSVINRANRDSWTVIREVLDLGTAIILSIVGCYIYRTWVFDLNYSINGLIFFFGIAILTALLPVSICFLVLYNQWKDVTRSTIREYSYPTINTNKEICLNEGKSDELKVPLDNIIMANAQDNYVLLHIRQGDKLQKHILRSTLKSIKNSLISDQFVQVHRSFIINRKDIDQLLGNKSKATLVLSNISKKIPVSRTYYDEIKNIINP